VLVNNAGVGMGELIGDLSTKKLDIQINTNFRSIPLFYREALDLLQKAGAEHRNALVVNTSSISGKQGEAWLSVYSATKHAVIGFTQAMNKELGSHGIKSTALAPGFVDTPMTDFVKEHVPAEQMIQPTTSRVRALPAAPLPRLLRARDRLRPARRRLRRRRIPGS
jgi:NAD(P)-dependent dehydrogenase (short-subunit alcohol dehydrogenase family)